MYLGSVRLTRERKAVLSQRYLLLYTHRGWQSETQDRPFEVGTDYY